MPGNRKKSSAVEHTLSPSGQVEVDSRTQNDQVPAEAPAPYQPSKSLPKILLDSTKEKLRAARNRHAADEGEAITFSNDHIKTTHRGIWQDVGFYSNHPNHNSTAINHAYIKSMMEKSHKLGKVTAKYSLFINKPTGKRAMLLQYPNRKVGQEYSAASGTKPLEIRIKPKCGIVEVDIPVEVHANYDRLKGVQYGEAMCKSRLLQDGSSYGLGGGLGIGPRPTLKNDRHAPPPDGPSQEKLLENFSDANNKGHVMNKITLGGHIHPFKNGDPIYVAATFKEDVCTWTKLDAIVQLRPHFKHLDAQHEARAEAKRLQVRAERPDNRDHVDPEPEVRAVNMAVKSTEANEEDMYGTMRTTAKLLRDMRDEPWQRLDWVDQEDAESYSIYNEALVYQDPDNAPQLVSEMTNEQYLDTISCPRIDPIRQGQKVLAHVEDSFLESEDGDTKIEIDDDTDDDDEDQDQEYETLPEGAIRPADCLAERRIERVARALCIHPAEKQSFYEDLLKRKLADDPKWAKHSFLRPGDRHHIYYKYRIAENRAGRGIDPEYDAFETVAASSVSINVP